ncbi:MAG TPA: homogentisate 1,2-dioxygenase [Acidimicrobiales bacterium]|nr:homogentisate 1,2-dioxygenase [Acidimicrobiales bacterium]
MPYYRSVGEIPPKRHTRFPRPDGSLHAEELIGQEGFSQGSSLLYHRGSPTAIVSIEAVADSHPAGVPNHPLTPRHLRTSDLAPGEDPVSGRKLLLHNSDVRIGHVRTGGSGPLHRNAVGDEIVFVHDGSGHLDSVFGRLRFRPGDYVVIPSSVIHRWVLDPGVELSALTLEFTGHVRFPGRYLSRTGQFLEHSPFCERDIHAPSQPLIEEGEDVEVLVRSRAGTTRYVYRDHPFDVVGWDGCVYPFTFSIHDFEPITGRIHQPPPVHQTFEADGVVVCSFVPRLYDYHPEAIAVPYNHSNVDTDEVLYYVEGDFMSRKGSGIGRGSISLHPAGHTHGPQPGSVEAGFGQVGTEEYAVMIDTFERLDLAPAALECEDDAYPSSWLGGGPG